MTNLPLPIISFLRFVKKELKQNPPDFASIYEKAKRQLGVSYFHTMSEYFIDKGYNPLNYLNYIPVHFMSRSDIQSFDIPENIEEIKHYAFSSCKNLKEITIPAKVTKIQEFAFSQCLNLQKVILEGDSTYFNIVTFHPSTILYCKKGSHTEHLAKEYGFEVREI